MLENIVIPKKFVDLSSVTYMFTGKSYIVTLKAYVWFVDGKIHKDKEPAMLFEDGSIKWYNKGNLHRIGGPAFVSKSNLIQHYVINGAYYSPQEYLEHPLVKQYITTSLLQMFTT